MTGSSGGQDLAQIDRPYQATGNCRFFAHESIEPGSKPSPGLRRPAGTSHNWGEARDYLTDRRGEPQEIAAWTG